MNKEDKEFTEKVLRRLCRGAHIGGMRFGAIQQILIDHPPGEVPPFRGQVYLNLSSRWKVFDARPDLFPDSEDELPELSPDKEIQTVVSIREQVITEIEVGETAPHLILTLEDGRILFMNGRHDRYESWILGASFTGNEEMWMVVACPDGGLAVWVPQEFVDSVDSANWSNS